MQAAAPESEAAPRSGAPVIEPAGASAEAKRRTRLGLLLIWLVALGLRLGPIDHGMPENYVPDTHLVRSALGMAQTKNPVPEVGEFSTYPNLLAYGLLPVYGAQYAAGRALGKWGGPEDFGRHALAHPEDVHLPARLLFALLSSLLPLVAFGAARAMNLTLGAWVAAWLAATGLLGVHFAIQERPWEPMVLFMLLTTWPAARYVATESRKALVLAGLAAAAAFGCHQAGGAALGIAGMAWALVFVRNRAELGAKAKRLVVDGVLAVAMFVAVGLGVGHPYLLVHGAPEKEQVVMGEELAEKSLAFSLGGQGFEVTFDTESFRHLFTAMFSYDPVLVVLGLLGFLVCWRRRCIWPTLAFLIAWGGLFLFSANDHVRYILPLVGLGCLPAGAFVERVFGSGEGRFQGAPLALRAGLVGALALPLVQAMRFSHVMAHEDLRGLAGEKLLTNPEVLPVGARLAVARYGPILPQSMQSLVELSSVRDLYGREAHRLAHLTALAESGHDANDPAIGPRGGAGIDVVYLADYLEFEDLTGHVALREGVMPELARDDFDGLLDALGATHVLLTDKTVGDGRLGLLDGKLSGLRAMHVWLPSGEELQLTRAELDAGEEMGDVRALGGAFEARLPTELDHAFHTIWDVERPGPGLYLFDRLGERP